ncbi:MAG: hypothetical protein A3D24_03270 [Candidatus Blackburnbacteria bacterium RIFCSPHIGHO2_02_FULL_39_13]|uniref:Uncharacterized protein n=1 Tax=Candidatus Blackburnbacteria bacterium RIFCSPLOWO2_01_FULL_40_20 TaxID=1797519 RepID=A0A1G1VFJ6_9BACT|nr:MAG: hypothetical protein A2694_04570 [Candidatus Blackburnbacteria bacterium RIFCSPHIGHO2_01_FULL_40_17]OGY08849.1 MAG: hypothetical protein A3D24_03270 [Candidatus Blackburnbacteria bacterium RIFCSPHIGHO2_02_FULL_39_13]OGY14223.1 MAG: hypothetical protein A3A77_01955 [Candidatus Blackburnbacteria bacterium RIFCSPLOWO2_01_FULL_40_20]
MNRVLILVIIALLIGAFFGGEVVKPVKEIFVLKEQTFTTQEIDFKNTSRKLWEDHIVWTREFITSAANNSSDLNNVAQRLLKNQEDIGNSIKPYYGEEAGNKLTDLLKTHTQTAGDLVKTTKAGSKTAADQAEKKWYGNADDIASFFANANPEFRKGDLVKMLNEHLALAKQEAVDILGKKPAESIGTHDAIQDQILKMSDSLSNVTINKFPDKFGK